MSVFKKIEKVLMIFFIFTSALIVIIQALSLVFMKPDISIKAYEILEPVSGISAGLLAILCFVLSYFKPDKL